MMEQSKKIFYEDAVNGRIKKIECLVEDFKRLGYTDEEAEEIFKHIDIYHCDESEESKGDYKFWTSEQWDSWTEDVKRRLFEPYIPEYKDAILDLDLVASQFGTKDNK